MLEIPLTTMATRAPSGKCGEGKRLENFPEVAQLGGDLEPIIIVAIPQAHMVLDVIKAETGKPRMLSGYAQENCKEQPTGFLCPVCPSESGKALPSQQLGDRIECA